MIYDKNINTSKSRFIIEVYHEEAFGENPMYVSVLGNRCVDVGFGGLYEARFFPARQTAMKAVERIKRYVDEAAMNGYTTYCYGGYDTSRTFHPLWGYFGGRMRSSDMIFKVREVELNFVD